MCHRSMYESGAPLVESVYSIMSRAVRPTTLHIHLVILSLYCLINSDELIPDNYDRPTDQNSNSMHVRAVSANMTFSTELIQYDLQYSCDSVYE